VRRLQQPSLPQCWACAALWAHGAPSYSRYSAEHRIGGAAGLLSPPASRRSSTTVCSPVWLWVARACRLPPRRGLLRVRPLPLLTRLLSPLAHPRAITPIPPTPNPSCAPCPPLTPPLPAAALPPLQGGRAHEHAAPAAGVQREDRDRRAARVGVTLRHQGARERVLGPWGVCCCRPRARAHAPRDLGCTGIRAHAPLLLVHSRSRHASRCGPCPRRWRRRLARRAASSSPPSPWPGRCRRGPSRSARPLTSLSPTAFSAWRPWARCGGGGQGSALAALPLWGVAEGGGVRVDGSVLGRVYCVCRGGRGW
jgi:hypothetical protein